MLSIRAPHARLRSLSKAWLMCLDNWRGRLEARRQQVRPQELSAHLQRAIGWRDGLAVPGHAGDRVCSSLAGSGFRLPIL